MTKLPQLPTSDDAPESPARRRTIQHLQKLLASAVAGASITCGACADPVVCDPLPPPITCGTDWTAGEMMQWLSWQATWRDDEGTMVVEVVIHIYPQNELAFAGPPTATEATVETVSREAYDQTVRCTPDEGASTFEMLVPLQCDADEPTFGLYFDVSETPADGQVVPSQPTE